MYIALTYYREFLILLSKHNVRYILVGGAAVHSHGYERGTNDVDLWVSPDLENMQKLFAAIREFGFDITEIEHHKFSDKDSPIKLIQGSYKIDIIHHLTNVVTFEQAWSKMTVREIGDFKYNLIDYYHLEQIKLATNRERDRIDVAEMRKVREIETGEKAKSLFWPRLKSLIKSIFKK